MLLLPMVLATGTRDLSAYAKLHESFEELGPRPGVGCDAAFKAIFPGHCAVSPAQETVYFPPRVSPPSPGEPSAWLAVSCPVESQRTAVADAICRKLGHPEGSSASSTCSGMQLLPDGGACGALPMAQFVVSEGAGTGGGGDDGGAWAAAHASGCQFSSVTCKPSMRAGERCVAGSHAATHTTCRVVGGVVRVRHGVVKELYISHQQHSCVHDSGHCLCW